MSPSWTQRSTAYSATNERPLRSIQGGFLHISYPDTIRRRRRQNTGLLTWLGELDRWTSNRSSESGIEITDRQANGTLARAITVA
ncbi:hypothetical protein L249_1978, partial [Ophiocordyceps polyrhachis-furcata BCC 54312]